MHVRWMCLCSPIIRKKKCHGMWTVSWRLSSRNRVRASWHLSAWAIKSVPQFCWLSNCCSSSILRGSRSRPLSNNVLRQTRPELGHRPGLLSRNQYTPCRNSHRSTFTSKTSDHDRAGQIVLLIILSCSKSLFWKPEWVWKGTGNILWRSTDSPNTAQFPSWSVLSKFDDCNATSGIRGL